MTSDALLNGQRVAMRPTPSEAPPAARRHRTAQDVADRLGVSRSTVSRAFTPGAFVAEKTREAILRAADEIGYRPNALAQALISQRSSIVAVVLGDLLNPFHSMLADSLTSALAEGDMTALTVKLERGQDPGSILAMLQQYRVAAVVVTSIHVSPAMIEACDRLDVPLVLLNRLTRGPEALSISSDLEQGGRLAAEHLVERGARRVAIVRGLEGADTAAARRSGFLTGLSMHGLDPFAEADGHYAYEGGSAAADALLSGRDRPDGVLCANDLSALGFMDRARSRHGVDVPGDMRVVGFDNIPSAAWGAYDLTSVHLPVNRMIDRARDTLASIVAGERPEKTTTLIPCRLEVRGSSGPATTDPAPTEPAPTDT